MKFPPLDCIVSHSCKNTSSYSLKFNELPDQTGWNVCVQFIVNDIFVSLFTVSNRLVF